MKPTIFFAIPCGWFYEEQRSAIENVCDMAGIDKDHRIIIEDDLTTDELWGKIRTQIERSDFFMADISSCRPNIALELGYAFKAKDQNRIALFISNTSTILDSLSDFSGKTRFQYSSLAEFRTKIAQWLESSVETPRINIADLDKSGLTLEEHFKDREGFTKRWNTPSGCQFHLALSGLRFTNAYYPILSSNLALLSDCEFTFRARIEREAIGWAVKGTVDYNTNTPKFCVMFVVTTNGMLRPHILSSNNPDKKLDYFALPASQDIPTKLDLHERAFSVITRCIGEDITVILDDKWSHTFNFARDTNFSEHYNSVTKKQGQIGFRCAGWRPDSQSGEVAIVNCVRVHEIV